jgi:glycosyltransferase involved in cell wall biosynthesis
MTGKMRILYFIQLPPPVHGVASINEFIFNNKLINEEIDKHLLEIKFSEEIAQLRKTTLRKIKLFFKLKRRLGKTLKQTDPDYVYFSIMPVGKGFWRDLLFVRQIKKSRTRTIYHLHNRGMERHKRSFIFRRLYEYIFSDSIIIHLSEILMEREIGGLNLNNSRTLVIPNGVPLVHIESGKKLVSSTRLLFVSNLFPAKGIYELLRIMQDLRNEGADVELHIVGAFMRSKYKEKFVRMMYKSGLGGSVHLLGPKYGEEKWKEYLEADIFIFPSGFKQECFPLVVLEAMQFGLPVIASRVGAIPEIIDHGENGLIIPVSDHDGFVGAVRELTGQKERLQKMGQAARQKYLDQYTDSHLEKNIRNLYDNYLIDIR